MESKPRQNHRGKKQRVPNVGINPLVSIIRLLNVCLKFWLAVPSGKALLMEVIIFIII
jgi:hypothetical protein